MIEARFGLQKRPFDKSIPSRDLYPWPGLTELAARLDAIEGGSAGGLLMEIVSRPQLRAPGHDEHGHE